MGFKKDEDKQDLLAVEVYNAIRSSHTELLELTPPKLLHKITEQDAMDEAIVSGKFSWHMSESTFKRYYYKGKELTKERKNAAKC